MIRVVLDIRPLYIYPVSGQISSFICRMFGIRQNYWPDIWCAGKTASGKSETVALLSGRTFASTFMVALLPLGMGRSATSLKLVSNYAKMKGKVYFQIKLISSDPRLLPIRYCLSTSLFINCLLILIIDTYRHTSLANGQFCLINLNYGLPQLQWDFQINLSCPVLPTNPPPIFG